MYRRCKDLGVKILGRMMVTSILTEGGRIGARAVGATAFNARTGEFVVLKGKAVIRLHVLPRGQLALLHRAFRAALLPSQYHRRRPRPSPGGPGPSSP